jgi:hypothetical protein
MQLRKVFENKGHQINQDAIFFPQETTRRNQMIKRGKKEHQATSS